MKNKKQEEKRTGDDEKGFEQELGDDSPVGDARRSFYSGA